MSPGGHLVATALAAGAVHAATGSGGLVAGLAAGGFLIDVDHVIDYVLVERRPNLSPRAFLDHYLRGRAERLVLALHSWELLALLLLLAWATGEILLWGYVLGMALHLSLDVAVNGRTHARNLVPFYSLAWRWRAGFRADVLVGTGDVEPAGGGFWAGFFLGARRRGETPSPSAIAGAAPRQASPRAMTRAGREAA